MTQCYASPFSLDLFSEDFLNQEEAKTDEIGFENFYHFDTGIIGIGFGQLIKEGRIDEAFKPYLENIINRQLDPRIVESWIDRKIINERILILKGLKEILRKEVY